MIEAPAARTHNDKITPLGILPFILMHFGAVAVVFYTGLSWKLALAAFLSYYLRMMGVTIGYHRYFSHRSFKTNRVMQFVMAWWAESSVQKGALWWAAHHRHHHKFSDQPDDIHSPVQRGFWWSHMGWMLVDTYNQTDWDRIKDFQQYPELVWLNRNWYVPPMVTGAAIWAAFGTDVFLWAGILGTVLLWHGTFFINSLSHVFGKRRYLTTDTSRNSMLLALLCSGEGWHNNHHFYQSTANQGWLWWQIDPSFYVIKAFQAVGLVWDVRTPPKHVVDTPGDEPLVNKLKKKVSELEEAVASVNPESAAAPESAQ